MQNDKNEKERKLSQAFLNPVKDRLLKWIEQIKKASLETLSDSVVDECNEKEQSAKECLNTISGFYMGHYDYSTVQKALEKCKKLGFR